MIVIEIILISYLGFVVFHNFFFSFISFFYSDKEYYAAPSVVKFQKIAVLIPAYKEDNVIVSTAQSACSHNYPSGKFTVVVIADSLLPETIATLKNTGATILEVSFEKSTKVKALQVALNKLEDYEIAVVLDADNIMEQDFLLKINNAYNNGFTCLQGRRTAKNINNSFSLLDGISESINNQIFRKGYNATGLSSSLIGSGMAFPFQLFKDNINGMNSIGGFDRELCLRLIESGQKIYYLQDAIVYDEKVEKPEVFAKQRRRWLSSQFVYLKRYFFKGLKSLFKGNFAFFEAAALSNLLLPRILMLGVLVLLSIAYFPIKEFLQIKINWPLLYLCIYMVALFIAVPKKYLNKKLLLALSKLPQAFIIMLVNLFRLRNANKSFIHTPHGLASSDSVKADK